MREIVKEMSVLVQLDIMIRERGGANQSGEGGDVEHNYTRHSESERSCRTWRLNIDMTKSKKVGSISCRPQTMMNQRDQKSEETDPERARV